uniref:Uncharacterized protein n=1 Tax=Lynx canadensis TaxID=61383 RepID=A0A667HII5_LYNCA
MVPQFQVSLLTKLGRYSTLFFRLVYEVTVSETFYRRGAGESFYRRGQLRRKRSRMNRNDFRELAEAQDHSIVK